MSYARKKYARLKPKLPTQNKQIIIYPFLTPQKYVYLWNLYPQRTILSTFLLTHKLFFGILAKIINYTKKYRI